MSKLIVEKLNSSECQNNGWILDGYPSSEKEARELEKHGIKPNRVFWLNSDTETCVSRLVNRRYNELDGKVVNILVDSHSDDEDLIVSNQDLEFEVRRRMAAADATKRELEKVYGYKTSESSTGVMQDIAADGVGETGVEKNRVMKLLNGSLLRPIPITMGAIPVS
jgi:adenylate kinase